MKRIVSILFLSVLLFSMMSLPSFAEGSGILALGGAEGKSGDFVSVDVSLNSNPGLITMKFSVSWHEDLELIAAENTKLLEGWTTPSPKVVSPYTIRWADPYAKKNNTATGKVLTLKFKIKENAKPGEKEITLKFSESWAMGKTKVAFNESVSSSIKVNCSGHQFSSGYQTTETEHSRICSACGYAESAEHNFEKAVQTKAPTCTESGEEKTVCSVCKKEVVRSVSALGHDMKKPVVIKKATCTEDGERKGYCAVCNITTKEVLKATGHSFGKAKIIKEATENQVGLKTYTCELCGEVKAEKIPILGVVIPEKDPEKQADPSPETPSNEKPETSLNEKPVTSSNEKPEISSNEKAETSSNEMLGTEEGNQVPNSEEEHSNLSNFTDKTKKSTFAFSLVLLILLSVLICGLFYWHFFHKKR
jgi:hypothetical protein